MLKLLANLSDCYTRVDGDTKELVLSTALSPDDRDVNKMIEYNKALATLDKDGFDAITEAEEIIVLDK